MNPAHHATARGTAIVAVVLALFAPGCAAPPRPARLSHIVLATLHNPAQRDDLIRDSDAWLAPIPGVVAYAVGPVLDTGRPTVDSSFDVGVYIGFETDEAYRAYTQHPAHIQFVERWKPRLKALRVHDFVDNTP